MSKGNLFWIYVFILPICLSVITFIIDCILNFSTAITKPNYIWAYFIYYLIFRLWLFIPFIIIFTRFFKHKSSKTIFLEIVYVTLVAVILSSIIFKNDLSMFNSSFSNYKKTLAYSISGLLVLAMYRFHDFKKNSSSQ